MIYNQKRVSSLYDALRSLDITKFQKYVKNVIKKEEDFYAISLAIHHCFSKGTLSEEMLSLYKEACDKADRLDVYEKAAKASKNMVVVVGFDPSLTGSGWSVIALSENFHYLLDGGKFSTPNSVPMPLRYTSLNLSYTGVMDLYQPSFVGVEKPQHNSSWSAGLYPLWVSITHHCLLTQTSFLTLLPPQVHKVGRVILGRTGVMTKPLMVDAAHTLIQDKISNIPHDVADAVITAYGALKLHLLLEGVITEANLSKLEAELFAKTVTRRKTGKVEGLGILYKEGDAYFKLDDEKYKAFYAFLNP